MLWKTKSWRQWAGKWEENQIVIEVGNSALEMSPVHWMNLTHLLRLGFFSAHFQYKQSGDVMGCIWLSLNSIRHLSSLLFSRTKYLNFIVWKWMSLIDLFFICFLKITKEKLRNWHRYYGSSWGYVFQLGLKYSSHAPI